ncbi:MAG: sulfide dehydrogenase [Planctomycetes bacterium]|uniref:sulfide dehydrogenase n=1 Tax=Candidatus Wunengus sp. YC65 TaxID=3367701 RepID=UPI001D60D183|nr:sulfide dehydrogenase [Planctomycetota bacterium]
MKKVRCIIIGFFLVVLIGTVFAESEIPGLIHSGQYSQGTLGSVRQSSPAQQSTDGVYNVGAYPLYTPELAQGEGREIIQIFCRFCHSTTYITMQPPLPAATWESVVNKMIDIYGAPISEDSARQIINYLRTYYTPLTRKQ